MLFSVALFGGLLLGIVWLGIWLWRTVGLSAPSSQRPASAPTSARQILDERYARGELTREQYQAMLGDLAERRP